MTELELLHDKWASLNWRHFGGLLTRPEIVFGPSVQDGRLAECAGPRSRAGHQVIRLEERFVTGLMTAQFGPSEQKARDGKPALSGLHWRYVEDVLLHEMVHQAVPARRDPHGAEFAAKANEIARRAHHPPIRQVSVEECWAWPMCARPGWYYDGDNPYRQVR